MTPRSRSIRRKMPRESCWPRGRLVMRSRELTMSRLILGKAGVVAIVVLLGVGPILAAGRGGGFSSRSVARGSVSQVNRKVGGSVNRNVDVNRNVTNVNRNVHVNRNIDFDRDIDVDVDHRSCWGR